MSISKEKVAELTKAETYIWTTVPSLGGAFDGARCIVAQDENTKPMRYLVCDACGKGYEGYLIKRTLNNERVYFCKHCDTDKQKQNFLNTLNDQAEKFVRQKLELVAEQLCNRVVDVLMIKLNIDESTRERVKQAIMDIIGTIKI